MFTFLEKSRRGRPPNLRQNGNPETTQWSTRGGVQQLVVVHQRVGRHPSGGEKWVKCTFTPEISQGDFTGCQKCFRHRLKQRYEISRVKGKIWYLSSPEPPRGAAATFQTHKSETARTARGGGRAPRESAAGSATSWRPGRPLFAPPLVAVLLGRWRGPGRSFVGGVVDAMPWRVVDFA